MTKNNNLDIDNSDSLNKLFSLKEAKEFFHIALKKKFKYIIGYHATKYYDFSGFNANGIIRANKDSVKSLALNIFRNKNITNDKEMKLIENIIDAYTIHDEMKIHFSIDKKKLLNESYHYLFFGEKNLQSLANQLTKEIPKINFKALLKHSGNPMILKCEIPLLWLNPEYLNCIHDLVQKHKSAQNIINNKEGLNFGFFISNDLPLENIIDKTNIDINQINDKDNIEFS